MPRSNLESIRESVRRCIDELSMLLQELDAVADCEEAAGRAAYKRFIKQLRVRQSELEDQLHRGRATITPMSREHTRKIEAAWGQLEISAERVSQELTELLTGTRGSLHSEWSGSTAHDDSNDAKK